MQNAGLVGPWVWLCNLDLRICQRVNRNFMGEISFGAFFKAVWEQLHCFEALCSAYHSKCKIANELELLLCFLHTSLAPCSNHKVCA